MRSRERLVLYPLIAIALVAALRAGNGFERPATAGVDAPADAPTDTRIAVVAAMKIGDELMDSGRFKPARVELEEKLNGELIRPTMEKLQELERKIKELDEKSPEFPQLREEYIRGRNELTAKQRETAQRAEALVSEQLKECFQLIRDSAAAIAEKKGFTFVLSSLRPDDKMQGGPVQATIRDLLSRPVVVFPKGVDITEEVREDLKL